MKKATGAADLSELTAVVKGTAQGIGRAIAASIRHAGADVVEADLFTDVNLQAAFHRTHAARTYGYLL